MNSTQISVKKHEGKIRLLIEWPVAGDDPDLMRKHHWDIPVVHALGLAAGLVSEVTALLRFPQKPERNRPPESETGHAPLVPLAKADAGAPTEASDVGTENNAPPV